MAFPVSVTETTILVLSDIVLVIIFVIGVVANSLVLLVFYRKPGLRTVSNRFVINLVATNLAACFVELPLVLADNLLGPSEDRRTWLCAADEGVTAAVCSASVLAVLLIALDQYWAVVDPLRYHARIGAARSAGMILSAWLVALIFGICGGIHLTTGPKPSLWYSCGNPTDPWDLTAPSNLYSILFAAIFSTCIFVLPFGAILWIYICIYTAAHRNSQRTRRRGSVPTLSNNFERQYFPIAEGNDDCERNKSASRKDKVNLQRSQTFAEGNVKIRNERKSSEGDISFKPIEITVICVNNEIFSDKDNKECALQEAIDVNNTLVKTNSVVVIAKNIAENASILKTNVPNSNQKTPLTAKFCVGPPEMDPIQESQTDLIVNEDEIVNNDKVCCPTSLRLKSSVNKCFPDSVMQPILKQTSFQSDISTPVHSSEPSSTIPKNIIINKTLDTTLAMRFTKIEEDKDLDVTSSIRPFSSLIKGFPHSNSMPTVTITPPQVVTARTSLSHNSSLRSSGNLVTTLRSRISNASLFRYREEMRAARISALVIIMALVNWLPYCALTLLYSNILNIALSIPHYVDALGLLSLSTGALISPCLFAYRNRKLQREVKKLLGFSKLKKEDGSSKREDQFRGDNNLSLDGIKKTLKRSPSSCKKDRIDASPVRKLWDWRGWKTSQNPESRFIESNLLQHNNDSLGQQEAKDAGLLLSCMKGSRWVRQEGVCDLSTLHNTALRTSVDTCRSSFSSGGSTNSTQCTSSSLETNLDN